MVSCVYTWGGDNGGGRGPEVTSPRSVRRTMLAAPAARTAPSDDVLLARFAEGDRTALDELFRRHRAVAYRVAYRLLGQEADALDAVQNGFVKVLAHLDRFGGRSSF